MHTVGTGTKTLVGSLAADPQGRADLLPRHPVQLPGGDDLSPGEPLSCLSNAKGGNSDAKVGLSISLSLASQDLVDSNYSGSLSLLVLNGRHSI